MDEYISALMEEESLDWLLMNGEDLSKKELLNIVIAFESAVRWYGLDYTGESTEIYERVLSKLEQRD